MAVRVLHVSDVHCSSARLARLLEAEEYDVVAVSGDLECVDTVRALGRARAPVVAVTGNLDGLLVAEALGEAALLLDGSAASVAGLRFAGVGGRDPLGDVERLRGVGRVDVLVTHYPPRGVLDETYSGCRGGLEAVRELVEALSPRLVLCGHVHEARGVARLGGSLVVNAGALLHGFYALVEVPAAGEPVATLRRLG